MIPPEARKRLRERYVSSHKQWGPRVLAHWARRRSLGTWSPGTISRVIADLVDPPVPKPTPVRYELVSSGVMWSEDGTGFRQRGKKRELLVLQDECSRLKVNHRLVDGPARADDVVSYLEEAFSRGEAPLVIKHDGDSIFNNEKVKALLDEHGIVPLTGPAHYPLYNGKNERSMRDIKSYEGAMRRYVPLSSLGHRIDAAVMDLNEHRPRPMLGGHTAREIHTQCRMALPDRRLFRKEVDRREAQLRSEARSRRDNESARRRAVEEVLIDYGLLVTEADVTTNLAA